MRSLAHVATVIWLVTIVVAVHDYKPEVVRSQVYIYRKTSIARVKIYHCHYNDNKNTYYDITDHCLQALKTGIFIDKWNDRNILKGSRIIRIEEDFVEADLLSNEIFLKSGSVCRYDRGFCYDRKVTINYAVVWEVAASPIQKCPDKLDQVFFGFVDIWKYELKNLKYLFYYEQHSDRAFYLNLGNVSMCHNVEVYYSGDAFIVSRSRLTKNSKPTYILNQKYFPLSSKKSVTESIVRNYDLQEFPLDFDKKITEFHLYDKDNMKTILKQYQELILDARMQLKNLSSCCKSNNTTDIKSILRTIDSLKKAFSKQNAELSKIDQKCIIAGNITRTTYNELIELKKSFKECKIEEFRIMNSTISRIYNQLHKADEDILDRLNSQEDDLVKLQQTLDELDIAVNNQIEDFITKEELKNVLLKFEGEYVLRLEDYRINLTSILDNKERELKTLYNNGQKELFDKYSKLVLKINDYYKIINDDIKAHNDQMELKLDSIKKILAEKVDDSEQNSLSNINKLDKKITNLQSEVDKCKISSSDYDILISNNVHLNQLIKKLNESLDDINKRVNNTVEENKQRVNKTDLYSVISKTENKCDKKMDELAKQIESITNNQADTLRNYCHEEILENMNKLKKQIELKYDNSLHDIEKNQFLNLTDLQQNTFNNVSSLKTKIAFVIDEISQLKKNLNAHISEKEDEIFKIINGNLSDLFKKSSKNYNNITKLNMKLGEIEGKCNDIEDRYLNFTVRLEGYLKKMKNELMIQLGSKITEIQASTSGNSSLIKSEIDEIKKQNEENNKLVGKRIEQNDKSVNILKQSIADHDYLLSVLSKNNNEYLNGITSNFTNIQKSIKTNARNISQIHVNLLQVESNIDDLYTRISKISNNTGRDRILLTSISGDIENIHKTLRGLEEKSANMKNLTKQTSDRFGNVDNSIMKNANNIEQLKNEISKNKKSAQLCCETVAKELNVFKTNVSNTTALNEQIFNRIRVNLKNNDLRQAKSDQELIKMKSQMEKIRERLAKNEKAVEDATLSTMTYVNARLSSVTEELSQIQTMLLENKKAINKIENKIFSTTNDNCCNDTKQKLTDHENTIRELNKKLSGIEDAQKTRSSDLNKRLKILEDSYKQQETDLEVDLA